MPPRARPRDGVAGSSTGASAVASQFTLVGTRIENVAQGATLGATKVARVATERVASLV